MIATNDKTTLYTVDSADRVRMWKCWFGTNSAGIWGIFYQDGLVNGKMKDPTFKEAKEKNVGKANYMSPQMQAQEMVMQEVGKKERSNYFPTPELAFSNKLWLPMLAHKFNDHQAKIPFPRYSQPKLDGARCNIYWSELEGKVVSKTRTGKDYFTTDHIVEELRALCEANKNLIFDGELYNHAYRHDFEQIMSLARQTKPTPKDLEESGRLLEYHVYDVYDRSEPNYGFLERMDFFTLLEKLKMVKVVESSLVLNQDEEDILHDEYLNESYEGQMIRNAGSIYKVDGRSQDLLKRKIFTDDEFEIVEVQEGQANWKGCAKRIVIKLPDGRTQGCGIDGSYEVNRERYDNRESIVGKKATVRYFRLTKDGMLYIPVCKDIDRHD
jgi:DNA ligase-1